MNFGIEIDRWELGEFHRLLLLQKYILKGDENLYGEQIISKGI